MSNAGSTSTAGTTVSATAMSAAEVDGLARRLYEPIPVAQQTRIIQATLRRRFQDPPTRFAYPTMLDEELARRMLTAALMVLKNLGDQDVDREMTG